MPTTITQEKALDFVKNIELPEIGATPAGLATGPDYSKQAFANDASLILFTNNVSLQHKQDILNSMCLAQRAAKFVNPGLDNPQVYYNKYTEVLQAIGYAVGGWQFTNYAGAGQQFSVDKVVIDILAAVFTGTEMTMVKTVIDALKNLQNDGGFTLFERESHSLKDGNFRIGVCDESAGVVGMKVGAFNFSSQSNVTKVLFFSWSSASASFNHSSQNLMLNDQLYNFVRAQVLMKLGVAAQQYVQDLPIQI
ncbi:MAG: hypothetical protein C0473_02820 [Cyanobacteria bacterium DS3.002]|nr:hypothetical protein [Cyanobacteria bacterium DS3.002]